MARSVARSSGSRRSSGPRKPRVGSATARRRKVNDAFLDIEMVGDTDQVYQMLRGLDSAFSVAGMNMFFVGSVAPYFRGRAERRFKGEGDQVVGKWAPLAPATLSIRQWGIDHGDFFGISADHPINVRTHEMEDYITGGRGDIMHTGASSSWVYPQVRTPKRLQEKVKTAQQGKGRTPARPVLGMNSQDLYFTVAALGFHIKNVTSGKTWIL